MTERFLKAIDLILEHEGGYNDIKEDYGSATNYGISLTFLKLIKLDLNKDNIIDNKDIKGLSKEKAKEIYWLNFWKNAYDVLPEKIAIKVFDVAVNAGDKRAHTLLQQSVNALGVKVDTDGLLGSETINAVKKLDQNKLLDTYCNLQADFYKGIVAKKPSQKIFLKGWLNRSKFKP